MSANENQIGGTHYRDLSVQPWDAMQSWMSPEAFAGYLLGNVIKYAARHRSKGGIEDLRKARHYLDKLIEQKEVMQSEGHSYPQPPATTPAASESAAGDWPGPDWSQAPGWANWWAKDIDLPHAVWYRSAPSAQQGYWTMNATDGCKGYEYMNAPHFNYSGHWRDSLRKRPA